MLIFAQALELVLAVRGQPSREQRRGFEWARGLVFERGRGWNWSWFVRSRGQWARRFLLGSWLALHDRLFGCHGLLGELCNRGGRCWYIVRGLIGAGAGLGLRTIWGFHWNRWGLRLGAANGAWAARRGRCWQLGRCSGRILRLLRRFCGWTGWIVNVPRHASNCPLIAFKTWNFAENSSFESGPQTHF